MRRSSRSSNATREQGIVFHALRTREAGGRRFVSVHVLVPGQWTVHHGHALLEAIERDIRDAVDGVTVFTHLESLDDPASWDDTTLDRPLDIVPPEPVTLVAPITPLE